MSATDSMPHGTSQGTPQILLAHHLKQLRLPTVLREYDKVARECARDGVDHPRYLLRLLELELPPHSFVTLSNILSLSSGVGKPSLTSSD